MKIRMATMLLAGSFFGLPITTGAQFSGLRVKHYSYSWQEQWSADCSGDDYDTSQLSRQIMSKDDWRTFAPNGYFYSEGCELKCLRHGHNDENFVSDLWYSGAGGGFHCDDNWVYPIIACYWIPDVGEGNRWSYTWQNGEYSESSHTLPGFVRIPLERCRTEWDWTYPPSQEGGAEHFRRGVSYSEAMLELVTGGTPGSTQPRMWQMSVIANTRGPQGGAPHTRLPPEQISVWGKPLDRYGYAYKIVPDNTVLDSTPTIPGECVSFYPGAKSGTLEIRWGGTNIAGRTTRLWVGEKLNLTCLFVPAIGTPSTTSYAWTITGRHYKDFVETSANDPIIEMESADYTKPTVDFFWTSPSISAPQKARCQVTIGGETMTAEADFDVRKPDASFWVEPRSRVQVTRNVAPNTFNIYWLTTGNHFTANNPEPQITDCGMVMKYRLHDLKGFSGNFEMHFCPDHQI